MPSATRRPLTPGFGQGRPAHRAVQPHGDADSGRRPRWRSDERGAVAAELVVATPILLLMILAVVQFALWEHATHVAAAAAQQGLAVSRVQGGTAAGGQAETQTVLEQLGSGVLVSPGVTATRTGATTTIVVTGSAESVIGLFSLPVKATATGPTENFGPGG